MGQTAISDARREERKRRAHQRTTIVVNTTTDVFTTALVHDSIERHTEALHDEFRKAQDGITLEYNSINKMEHGVI